MKRYITPTAIAINIVSQPLLTGSDERLPNLDDPKVNPSKGMGQEQNSLASKNFPWQD